MRRTNLRDELSHLCTLTRTVHDDADAGCYSSAEIALGQLRTQVARVRKLVRERRAYATRAAIRPPIAPSAT